MDSFENSHGVTVTNEEDIENVASEYFKELFKSSQSSSNIDQELFSNTLDDMARASLDCKAPSPDGLQVIFLQKMWHIVVDSVASFVLVVLNDGKDILAFNKINMVLIPKIKKPTKML